MKRVCLLAGFLLCALAGFAQTKVVAHRGFWKTDGSAQNSIAALRKADSIACYGAEFDVYLTTDNQLVVHHDRSREGISMITDSTAKITALTLKNGETVPTLDAYLNAAKQFRNGTRLILEIKALGDERRERLAVALVIDKLLNFNLMEQTDIISFSKEACLEAIRLAPQMRVQYLEGDLSPQELNDLGFAAADYQMDVFRQHPDWIDECHRLGLEVNVWTVNKEEDLHEFLNQGVDYITTNEPVLLQRMLGQR